MATEDGRVVRDVVMVGGRGGKGSDIVFPGFECVSAKEGCCFRSEG